MGKPRDLIEPALDKINLSQDKISLNHWLCYCTSRVHLKCLSSAKDTTKMKTFNDVTQCKYVSEADFLILQKTVLSCPI